MARALADAGAHVTLIARTSDEIKAVRDDIVTGGGAAAIATLDVTQSAHVDAFFATQTPFNVLVNNAGTNRPAPLVDTPDSDIEAVFNLNVLAAFRMAREVARGLIAHKQPGSIINVSSQMGHVGAVNRTVYCASKHALEGLSKALATLNELYQQFGRPVATREAIELANVINTGWLVTRAALEREESRGAHFRSDFPELDSEWHCHLLLREENSELVIERVPVR